jgi:hypothetical protein
MQLALLRFLLAVVLSVAAALPAPAQDTTPPPVRFDAFPPFLVVNSWYPPTLFHGTGETAIVYELFVTNAFADPVTITQVVADGGRRNARFSFAGDALKSMIRNVGSRTPVNTSGEIAPGASVIVFMWLPLREGSLPTQLRHEIHATVAPAPDEPVVQTYGPLKVTKARPTELDVAPLAGPGWLAASGPSNTSAHRVTWLSINGTPRISQRFAIDFVQLRNIDGKLQFYSGDMRDNNSWFAYGADVYAVADGVVVAKKDGIADNIPGEGIVGELNIDTLPGNNLVIAIGHGRYACYAHLVPGSARVEVGDFVRAGQVIGKLGQSGNSSGPHLHFHVTNGPSFVRADGEPWRLPHLRAAKSILQGDPSSPTGDYSVTQQGPLIDWIDRMPVEDMIVEFPTR